jgi:hypothetical protein
VIAEPTDSARIISTAIQAWPSDLEVVLFATGDPTQIVRLVAGACMSSLGSPLERVIAYRRGVGVVVGVQLRDRRRVAIKVHRHDLVPNGLAGIRAVQMHLADAGLPVPRPLGNVVAIGRGLASPEEWLDRGIAPDAHEPVIRREIVRELRRFIASATPMVHEVTLRPMHPYGLPPEQLWPTPHDLRFDLTLDGGEWIDEIGAAARRTLDATPLPAGVGHVDWRSENLRFDGADLVAILDWDSLALGPESAIVGANASAFTADWGRPETNPYPSPHEISSFVAEYEAGRGASFVGPERVVLGAALQYRLAYAARCQHSDGRLGIIDDLGPDSGYRGLLKTIATAGLPRTAAAGGSPFRRSTRSSRGAETLTEPE